VHQPDSSAIPIPIPNHHSTRTIYVNVKEIVPIDALPPLAEDVILTSYIHPNLCHHFTTGRSVTGILHLMN